MPFYRKKPVIVEAMQLRWDTWNDLCDFAPVGKGRCFGVYVNPDDSGDWSNEIRFGGDDKIGMIISTLEGDMLANDGDYIIKGIHGEFYPCKPDIFEETYEGVNYFREDIKSMEKVDSTHIEWDVD